MKKSVTKLYILIAVLFLAFPSLQAQTPTIYFSDDFENGLNKWLISGEDWDTTSATARAGKYCITESPNGNYPPNANEIIATMNQIDLTTAANPILTFWDKYSIDNTQPTYDVWGNVNNGSSGPDSIYVEISKDNGFTWKPIKQKTGYLSTWTYEQIDLTPYTGTKIKVRFRLWSNGDVYVADGWYIDDVAIKEIDQRSIRLPFTDNFEDGLSQWQFSGEDWDTTSATARAGKYCITESPNGNYPPNANEIIATMNQIDLTTAANPILTFWDKYSIDNTQPTYDVWGNVNNGSSGPDSIYVEISKDNGFTWKPIKQKTGYLSTWTYEQIDLTPYTGTKIKVRFRLSSNRDVYVADGWYIDDVAITAAISVVVISPNGGETWTMGSTQNIKWTASEINNVKIKYSTNNGTNWYSVIDSIPASIGSYSWIVPNTLSSQCLVGITDLSDTTVYDVSNGVFIISPAIPTPAIPANGLIGVSTNPVLTWNSSTGATGYRLQVSTDSTFTTTTYDTSGLTTTSKSIGGLSYQTKYYWRVNANTANGTSNWSVMWNFTTYSINNLALAAGWSMISFDFIPVDSLLDSIFVGVKNNIVITKDGAGHIYWPSMGINQIGNWNYRKGYQVYMNGAGTLTAVGGQLPAQTPIPLPAGWNLVAYLSYSSMLIDTALASVKGTLVMAKDGDGDIYWPVYGINTIGSMMSDQGYQLYVNDSCTLIYPANLITGNSIVLANRKTSLKMAATVPTHFVLTYVKTGSNATLLVETSGLNDADEIGVFGADGEIVGSGVIAQGRSILTIWGDNTLTKDVKEGAVEGEGIALTSWSKQNGQETPLIIRSVMNGLTRKGLDNALVYSSDAVLVVQADKGEIPQKYLLEQNYPNPFNPSTIIKYGLPNNSRVRLEIYDIIGRRIKVLVDEVENAGYHQVAFNAEAISSGVYFYRLSTGSFSQVKKMMILK